MFIICKVSALFSKFIFRYFYSSQTSASIRRILKNTRFVISDHDNNHKLPREDYHRNQQGCIEEYDEGNIIIFFFILFEIDQIIRFIEITLNNQIKFYRK